MPSIETPLEYTVLSTVKPTPINWLWKPYIPRAAMTTIIGDGGYGKSYMTCAIAASLSRGDMLPGQQIPKAPMKILMISAEDGIGPVIMPRLQALGANMDNIAAYDEGFTINPRMTQKILLAVEQFDAAVVFLDPMVVYLGGEVDFFKANEVRSTLTQLNHIAKAKDIAIVCVHHVKKGPASGQHKSLGSVDFVNGVRSTLLVDVSKTGTYFMSHVKHNWSAAGPTLAYSFNQDKFHWMGEYEPGVGGEPFEVSKTPRGKARLFLLNVLKDGPVPMVKVLAFAKEQGMNETTLQRAKKGVCHSRRMDDMTWAWELDEGIEVHPEAIGIKPDEQLAAMAGLDPSVSIQDDEPEMVRLMREAQEALQAKR